MAIADTIETINRALGGKRVTGRTVRSGVDMHKLVAGGLPVAVLGALGRKLELGERTLARALGIPDTTFQRRKAQGLLSQDESERAYRLARLVAVGEEALGSAKVLGQWLQRPNRALGGAIPMNLIRNEPGAREVEAVLGRMLYGGYS